MAANNYSAFWLDGQTIWNASIKYYIYPESMTWAANVVTVNALNHGLLNNDVINTVDETNNASSWNTTTKTITFVDKNTFTFPLVGSPGAYPTNPNPSTSMPPIKNSVRVDCPAYSMLTFQAGAIQIEALPAATSVAIQGKIVDSAPFINLQTVTTTDGDTMVTFAQRYNIVRVARTVGSGQPIIHAQRQ